MQSLLPVPLVHWIVVFGIDVIIFALFIRVLASWFRIDERYAIIRFLARLTDPFLAPIRRFVPPVGLFDLSWIIAFFLLQTLQLLLLQALPGSW